MKTSFAFITAAVVAVATFVAVFTLGAVIYRSVNPDPIEVARSSQANTEIPTRNLLSGDHQKKARANASTRSIAKVSAGASGTLAFASQQEPVQIPKLFIPAQQASSSRDELANLTTQEVTQFENEGDLKKESTEIESELDSPDPSQLITAKKPVIDEADLPGLAEILAPVEEQKIEDEAPQFSDFANDDLMQELVQKSDAIAEQHADDDLAWLLSMQGESQQYPISQELPEAKEPEFLPVNSSGISDGLTVSTESINTDANNTHSLEDDLNELPIDAMVAEQDPVADMASAKTEVGLALVDSLESQEEADLVTQQDQEGRPERVEEISGDVPKLNASHVTTVSNTASESDSSSTESQTTQLNQETNTATPQIAKSETLPATQSTVREPASDQPVANRPSIQSPSTSLTKTKSADEKVTGWPLPDALLSELKNLETINATKEWSIVAQNTFDELNQLKIADERSFPLVIHIGQLADQLSEFSQSLATDPQAAATAAYMKNVADKMHRRSKIWLAVHRVAHRQFAEALESNPKLVANQISNRTAEIQLDELDADWAKYLMLNEANEIFANPKSRTSKRQAVARKVLARATSTTLTTEQANYAQSLIGNDLGNILRDVAIGKLDLGTFLIAMEAYEKKPSANAKAAINSFFQGYYWSRDKQIQELSNLIDEEYRSSNIYLEFSQRMINRLVPRAPTSFNEPVSETILGARVRGHSRISNRIQVQLVPDPYHLSFRLFSNGRVLSNTSAHARGFVFDSLGNALVNASKTVAIGQDGLKARPTTVQASSQSRLTGIQSNLDAVPVVGWMARRIAQQQQQASDFKANKIVESRLKNEFRSRVDSELEKAVSKAKVWVQQHVFSPLQQLELEPTVMRLQTGTQSAIVHYRLAALDHNASDSPRPIVSENNLLSFQMHSSAINNMISRAEIAGRKFTPETFVQHLNKLAGQSSFVLTDQTHDDVTFEFAKKDPIQLDFQNGRIDISLRLRRLQIGKHNRWDWLIVTASYRPSATGNHIFMTFDEEIGMGVKKNGKRMRLADQLAVRTVFMTLFQPQFDFELLPPEVTNHQAMQGVAISELGLERGWLTIAFNEVTVLPYNSAPTFQARRPGVGVYQDRMGRAVYSIGDRYYR